MQLKEINRRIKAIARSTTKMNEFIHETAVGCLVHAKEHGDCTAALRLVQCLPKSFRRNLLINWFADYSPIGMNVSTGKVAFHKEGSKAYNPFDIDAARLTPWYNTVEAQKEDLPDTTAEDARKKIFALAGSFQKKLDAAEVAEADRATVIDLVARLKELGRAAA